MSVDSGPKQLTLGQLKRPENKVGDMAELLLLIGGPDCPSFNEHVLDIPISVGQAGLILLCVALRKYTALSPADLALFLLLFRTPLLAHTNLQISAIMQGELDKTKPLLLAISDRRYIRLQGCEILIDIESGKTLSKLPPTRQGVTYDITGLITDQAVELGLHHSD